MRNGYWDEHTRTRAESLRNMNRELVKFAGIRPGTRILDLGCGTGESSVWLAEQLGAEVTGISASGAQVDDARAGAARRGMSHRVIFEAARYHDTGLDSGAFDFVWARESVGHTGDKSDFLREAHRVLRGGGRIAVQDTYRETHDTVEADERLLREWTDARAVPDIETVEEFKAAIVGAGFTAPRSRDVTRYTIDTARRGKRAALVLGGPSWLGYRAGLRPRQTHRTLVHARLRWALLERRLVGVALVTAEKPCADDN